MLLFGCAAQGTGCLDGTAPSGTATAPNTAIGFWTAGNGIVILQQAAVLSTNGAEMQMDCMVRLDFSARTARLVALAGFGMKLFDIEATPTTLTVHSALPVLDRLPHFLQHAAEALRRLYLTHQPAPEAPAFEQGTGLVLVTRLENGEDRHRLDRTGRLLETQHCGRDGQWTIAYEYSDSAPGGPPRTSRLDDTAAGYRLTLQLTSVRHHE
ncbi:DUF3261 domain-containing protein [Paucidesulfovibrio longus]|uniref:DUF3261 domain-containing protein n=1 Tax=Paucidesulfovibrio longus TaxID=889 RepID=UPI00138B1A44|nr:DUF3261 domain-containing protein [Paucidesulfovibrio longus]